MWTWRDRIHGLFSEMDKNIGDSWKINVDYVWHTPKLQQ
jgi:hypothetical protein